MDEGKHGLTMANNLSTKDGQFTTCICFRRTGVASWKIIGKLTCVQINMLAKK